MGKKPDFGESIKALQREKRFTALIAKYGVPDLKRKGRPFQLWYVPSSANKYPARRRGQYLRVF